MQNRVLTVPAGGRIGIANVSARTVARPTRTVIPAAGVLRYITADGALVPDLWRSGQFCALRQKTILLPDDRVLHDLGERGHRTDLNAVAGRANTLEFLYST